MRIPPTLALAAALLLPALAGGCGSSGDGDGRSGIDPGDFVARVDNVFFPLTPGTMYTYKGRKDGQPTREVFSVTRETKKIEGVTCVVVHDKLYSRGKLSEDTIDWYAQDRKGNVWYFGEDTKELGRDGKVTSTEGTWQAGVDGARPGIFMPAHPRVGDSFQQEYYKGHAEDRSKVIDLSASISVPYALFRSLLVTEEWTPLEPGVRGRKYYARGLGTVKEITVKGGDEVASLASVKVP